jgi:hypothetical protein
MYLLLALDVQDDKKHHTSRIKSGKKVESLLLFKIYKQ